MATARKDILSSLIPEAPATRTAPELQHDLKRVAPALAATLRTIQRDLDGLMGTPGLHRVDSKPHRWSWTPGRKRPAIARMEPEAALAFSMLEEHLRALIPSAVRAHLDPYFAKAGDVVDQMPHARLKRWKTRTAVRSREFPLRLPPIDTDVLTAVQQAILDHVQLDVLYQSAAASEPSEYKLHPQGLILSDGVFYLAATVAQYTDVRQFALHRMRGASLSTERSRDLSGFDVDTYARGTEGFHFGSGARFHLKLRVRDFLAVHLRERPLSEDQRLRIVDDEWSELTATVAESWQLEWWLRSFASQCEVLRPLRLRRAMHDEARRVLEIYESEGPS